jgi:hypothetical protein
VTDILELAEHQPLTEALSALKDKRGLDLPCSSSPMFPAQAGSSSPPNRPFSMTCPIPTPEAHVAAGVVSRKKQLLPVVLGLLSNGFSKDNRKSC